MDDIFSWVISLRSDTLTPFFKIFPHFVSDHFFILLVALGFWRQPKNRLFLDLGFLIPFSTLLNCILEILFAIPRPDASLHLLPMHDSFGFPSGDVQVAVVVWGMICLATKSRLLLLFALCLVSLIMISRIYLGVHSFYDVMGGLCYGLMTIALYKQTVIQSIVSNWFTGKVWSYWGVVIFFTGIYLLISPELSIPMVIMSVGAFLGYGLCLPWLSREEEPRPMENHTLSPPLLTIGVSLGILIGTAFLFPVVKTGSMVLYWSTSLLKYAVIVLMIYLFLPYFQRMLSKKMA